MQLLLGLWTPKQQNYCLHFKWKRLQNIMIKRIVKCILFLSILTTPMVAQDWQKLDGMAIEEALNSRTLGYGQATQDLFADGRTSYKTE